MMYYINKIVGWILSPMGIVFLGAAACAVAAFFGRRKTAWGCGVVSVLLLWMFGCPVTVRLIGKPLECIYDKEGFAHGDVTWAPTADAIVVLGGGMTFHQKCGSSEMYSAADRVWIGAKLYKLGKAPKIICTSSDIVKSTLPLLFEMGIPREAVVWYDGARNTEEEARQMAKELWMTGTKPKVLLVTSAWHMNRAKFLFEKAGLDVVPCPGDFEMSCVAEKDLEFKDFIPEAWAFLLNSAAVKEWVGNWAYKLLK